MGKSQETFSKKEREKKKLKKRQDKEQKKEERKSSSLKGQGLEAMFAYVDHNGNLTDTPPDPKKKYEINQEDIRISTPKMEDLPEEDKTGSGVISYFNTSKGYGFIKVPRSNVSYFVHANNLTEQVGEGDKVTFEIEQGPRGAIAVNVRKVTMA